MNNDATPRGPRPVHLWIVGILALLWNAVGAFDYLATQLPIESYMAQFTPEQRTYFDAFPSWAVAAWAFGVWGAFVGSLLLLFRSRWAVWSFAISLAGMAVSFLYQFGMTEGAKIVGTFGLVFTAVIVAIAILLFWYAVRQKNNGVLR